MYENLFRERLSRLRSENGVSAQDMSLSIGYNHSYIHTIEAGRSDPSMSGFFYICEFLKVSPKDFFDFEMDSPKEKNELEEKLPYLSPRELRLMNQMADEFIHSRQ